MSTQTNIVITDARIYDDAKNPNVSDYMLLAIKTVPEAVIDPKTNRSFNNVLDDLDELSGRQTVASHNVDPTSHPDIRELINDLKGRVRALEIVMNDDIITSNAFIVTFGNLDGINVNGVWYPANARLEF